MKEIRVACLLGDGFEESEFQVPYQALRNAGIQVDVIGVKAGAELRGKSGKATVTAEAAIDAISPESYQALLIPGGYSPDHLRLDKRVVEFVRRFEGLKRPVAAICHGAQLLMAARLVQGRTLTAWPTVQEDLALAGANVKDEPVVIDGNWITSRKPADLEAFSQALLHMLGRGAAAQTGFATATARP